jgi:hypothetical protein
MGCDIHANIDYDYPDSAVVWSLGEINIQRNYGLFSLMANVRGTYAEGFNPKGLPDQVSYDTLDRLTIPVYDDPKDPIDYSRAVDRKQADAWHQDWLNSPKDTVGGYANPAKLIVHHPDWHSHSWLNVKEMSQIISWMKKYEIKSNAFRACYHAMKSLHEDGCTPRLVFWFDS